MMTRAVFKLGREEFVVIPRKEYERIAAQLEEDARDIRKAKAALAHFRRTGRSVSLETLKRELKR